MSATNSYLLIIRQFLLALTWKRIMKLSILMILILSLVLLWAYRDDVLKKHSTNRLSTISLMTVSPEIQNEIDSIVKKSDLILGIRVITINFQKNIKTDSYVSIDDPLVQEVYSHYANNKVYESPLFSENKDRNKRLLRLISGEFVCVPYTVTETYAAAPSLDRRIKQVCAAAIPPYNGDFSGIFAIYLGDTPTKDDTERLFLLSRDLSLKIYEENSHDATHKNIH